MKLELYNSSITSNNVFELCCSLICNLTDLINIIRLLFQLCNIFLKFIIFVFLYSYTIQKIPVNVFQVRSYRIFNIVYLVRLVNLWKVCWSKNTLCQMALTSTDCHPIVAKNQRRIRTQDLSRHGCWSDVTDWIFE